MISRLEWENQEINPYYWTFSVLYFRKELQLNAEVKA